MSPFANISLPDMSLPYGGGPALFLFWMMVVVAFGIWVGMKEDK
jgi:hypothetical protein